MWIILISARVINLQMELPGGKPGPTSQSKCAMGGSVVILCTDVFVGYDVCGGGFRSCCI